MSSALPRSRVTGHQDDSDEWLIDAARRAGHAIPRRERPAGTSAWRVLLIAGIDDEEILRIACAASGTDAADVSRVSPALSAFLPHPIALKHRVAPLGVHNGVLRIATYNPQNAALERELAFASRQRVLLQSASPSAILRAQATIYGTVYGTRTDLQPSVAPSPQPAVVPPPAGQVARLSQAVPAPSETPGATPNLADRLLSAAVTERADEAQIEPIGDGGLIVRFRVDGTLNDRFRVSEAHATRTIQALKTLAGLDPSQTRLPLSGRATFQTPQGIVALRISTEPRSAGQEKLVVRLFTPTSLLALSDLGYSATERARLDQLLAEREGLVLVVGPQSSGTTRTLYAALRDMSARGRKVVTLEDPMEYSLEGVQQTDAGESPYPTIASATRAILGAACDVVLVSPLTEAATAEALVAGSRQKQLVLATLDSSDMASAMQRLYELVADAGALASSVKGVVAQRLVRRLCAACAVPQSVSELPEAQQELLSGLPTSKLRRAVGCARCRGTGYEGRTAVVEVVPITHELQDAIARRADAPALALLARECGITNLWDSGLSRVLDGVTSIGELLDHVSPCAEAGEGTVAQGDIDALLAQLLGAPMKQRLVATPEADAPPSAPIRVLLVDDDAPARRALAKELASPGIGVIEAADGASALVLARRLRPDVILTEVALPRLDAIGLLQGLAAESFVPAVVAFTSQEDAALHALLREEGAVDVLSRDTAPAAISERLLQAARDRVDHRR
jgi:type II secretory ATPase GspE/PulE/Tfp pilus assembly ATPase PilB-like protein/ActR/RegA family two-component response regulator